MPRSIVLTDDLLNCAEPRDRDYFLWDRMVMGLALRITRGGCKAWVLNYRTPKRGERRHTIGRYPEVGINEGRSIATELKLQIRNFGYDPLEKPKRGLPPERRAQLRAATERLRERQLRDRAIALAVERLGLIKPGETL